MKQQSRRIKKLMWHNWQLEIIKNLAGKVHISEICKKVGRTESAVRHKANLHGFKLAFKG